MQSKEISLSDFAQPQTAAVLESMLRLLAKTGDPSPGSLAEKYGADLENEKFRMRRYCWCEGEECPWCGPENSPNFLHKPSGLKIWWYKYIGRGMLFSREPSSSEAAEMLCECLGALESGIPSGTVA